MLHVSLLRSYRSKKGNPTFVYEVSGSASDLTAFETAQGDFHRTDVDTGKPLWFTTRCIGPKGTLIITSNGNVVPDMSAFDQAASLASQYGGNFGEQLAKMSAEQVLGKPSPSSPTPQEQPQPKEADEDEGFGDL